MTHTSDQLELTRRKQTAAAREAERATIALAAARDTGDRWTISAADLARIEALAKYQAAEREAVACAALVQLAARAELLEDARATSATMTEAADHLDSIARRAPIPGRDWPTMRDVRGAAARTEALAADEAARCRRRLDAMAGARP